MRFTKSPSGGEARVASFRLVTRRFGAAEVGCVPMRALMQLVEGDHSIVRMADLAKVAPEVLAAARAAAVRA